MAEAPWWTRPRVVAALLLVLLVGSALLEEHGSSVSNGRLTSYASDAGGVDGLARIAQRLGWTVERRLEPFRAGLSADAIYLVLDPPEPVTSSEAAALLDAVRRGAGLVLAPGINLVLGDSLRVTLSTRAEAALTITGANQDAVPASLITRGNTLETAGWPHYTLRFTGPPPGDSTVFVRAGSAQRRRATGAPVILGLTLGMGRIAILADPDLLRNQLLRRDDVAIVPIRLFEWLGHERPRPLVFAEYHQGFGVHASVPRTVSAFLGDNPWGRGIAQVLIAGLLLLVAVGARPLPPNPIFRIQRRSAMEHVDALAHAYEQAGASRTAAQRLVRGLQRRHPMGTLRVGQEADYLAAIAARFPALTPSADALARAVRPRAPASDAMSIGAHVTTIERTLSSR